MTPFPIPLTTPPVTSMNLVIAGQMWIWMWLTVNPSQPFGKKKNLKQARTKISIATDLRVMWRDMYHHKQ